MVDLKTKKIFLKKSPCPDHVSKEDFVIGGKVLLYVHIFGRVGRSFKNNFMSMF